MKLSGKILIFVVALVVVSVMAVTFFVMMDNASYRNEVNRSRVASGVEDLKHELDKMSEKTKYCAVLLAQNKNIISGVEYANFLGLRGILNDLNADLELSAITVTNEEGSVMIRQHDPDNLGDNIGGQHNVQQALASEISSTVQNNDVEGLSCQSGAPIENQRGDIIGTVVAGFAFHDTTLLESLKEDYGMEFTIFSGSTRLATTLTQNNDAAMASDMDSRVQDAVLEQGQTYTGDITLFGKPYIACYTPLTDKDGNIIGALAAAQPQEEANAATMKTLLYAIYAAVGVIVVSVVMLLWFVRRSIRKPMMELVTASQSLADGNMDIRLTVSKRKDEIGMLGKSFEHVVNVIGGLIRDIAALEDKVSEGHLLERADESQYKGEYRTVMQGYNKTVSSLVNYVDKLPLPILILDKDFNMRYINENGAELLESTQEALLGSKCHELFCTDDCQTEKCVCLKAMETAVQQQGETVAHLMSGTVLEIRYMGIPIVKDEEVVGALEAITDLTEIKKAYRKSEEQSAKLKALLEKTNEAANLVSESARQVSEGSQVLSQGATDQAAAIQQLSSSIVEISQQTQLNAQNSEKASAVADKTRNDATAIDDKMHKMLGAMSDISQASTNISKIIKTIDDIAFQTNILALNAAVEAARAGIHGKGFAVVADEVRSLAAKSAVAAKNTAELIQTSNSKVGFGTKVATETADTLSAVVAGITQSAELMDLVAVASRQQTLGISQVERGIEQVSDVIQNITATAQESAAASEELSGQAALLTGLASEHNMQDAEIAEGSAKRPRLLNAPATSINLDD